MDDDRLLPLFEAPDISCFDKLFATMFGAVQNGDIDGLKAIRSAETEPFKEHLSMNGGLLLFEAVRMGLYDVGEFLLANGCSLRMCLGMKSTALHLAAYNLDAADFLDRLAMYSSNCVNAHDVRYNTPLHVASACNNVRGVQTLLNHGADVHHENMYRQCSLDLALAGGHVDCVSLLLEQYENLSDISENLNFPTDFTNVQSIFYKLRARTQMDVAAKSLFDVMGHKNVVQALKSLHCWDKPRSNEIIEELKSIGLHLSDDVLSSVKPRLQCIDLLIKKKFEFNMLHLSLKHLSHDYYFQAMKSLIEEYGMPVNSNVLFYTPLHFAVDRSDFEGVEYLLDHGAKVNNDFSSGVTPLEIALQKRVLNEDIVRLLVERGAKINFIRSNGWCPLKGVLERHNEGLAQFLVDRGADVDLKNPDTGFTIFFEFLFMTLSRNYNIRAMSFLLERGASLIYEESDATPLHFIASTGTSRHHGCVDFMKLLIKYSDDINPVDAVGNTPLLKAIKVPFHSAPIIRLLLEAGADPRIRNSAGEAALDLAITLRKVDVIALLMEHCVEFDPDVLFSKTTVLLDSIIINMPYNRDELFAMRSFLVRQDVVRERRCLVEKFVANSSKPGCDYLNDMFICLHELLRNSPVERSCMATITSGQTVLFSEAEHCVLKTKLSTPVNESRLRGVLEYRIVVNEDDTYIAACDREISSVKEHKIFDGITLSFLQLPESEQLLLLSRVSGLHQALSDCLSFMTPMPIVSMYPIFGVTLFRMITDILAKFDLLSAAEFFLNSYVSRIRHSASQFKSLPQHIVDDILGYLSADDMSKLIFLEDNIFPKSIDLLRNRWKMWLLQALRQNLLLP